MDILIKSFHHLVATHHHPLSINHFKDSFCMTKRKTTNEKTPHSDSLPAGTSQLLTVIVADKINQRQRIRSLKSLIAYDLSTLHKHYAY